MNKTIHILLLFAFAPVIIWAQSAGSLDSTYNGTGIVYHTINPLNKTAFQKIRLQPDGKSVAFGYTKTGPLYEQRTTVTRFNTDGTPDLSFGVNGTCLVENFPSQGVDGHILPDGKIIAASTGFYPNTIAFTRILSNGMVDSTFGLNGIVSNYQAYNANLKRSFLLPDGKLVTICDYIDINVNNSRGFVGRYFSNGYPDTTFGNYGIVKIQEPNGQIDNIIADGGVQPDGKIMVVGTVGVASNIQNDDWLLIRLNEDGSLDQGFGNGGKVRISMGNDITEACQSLIFLPDGKFYGAGHARKFPGFHFTIARFNNDGTLDPTYGFSGKAQIGMNCCYSSIYDMALQADGKIVACGYASSDNQINDFAIARFKTTGAVDQTFGNSGKVILRFEPDTSQYAPSLAIQSDNKILIGGFNTKVDEYGGVGVMVRLNPGAVTVNTDTPESAGVTELQLQPNPVAGNTVELKYTLENTSPITMNLYDLTGRKVSMIIEKATRYAGDNQETIQLPADLPQGQYYLRMMTETGFATMKFVKL